MTSKYYGKKKFTYPCRFDNPCYDIEKLYKYLEGQDRGGPYISSFNKHCLAKDKRDKYDPLNPCKRCPICKPTKFQTEVFEKRDPTECKTFEKCTTCRGTRKCNPCQSKQKPCKKIDCKTCSGEEIYSDSESDKFSKSDSDSNESFSDHHEVKTEKDCKSCKSKKEKIIYAQDSSDCKSCKSKKVIYEDDSSDCNSKEIIEKIPVYDKGDCKKEKIIIDCDCDDDCCEEIIKFKGKDLKRGTIKKSIEFDCKKIELTINWIKKGCKIIGFNYIIIGACVNEFVVKTCEKIIKSNKCELKNNCFKLKIDICDSEKLHGIKEVVFCLIDI